MTTTAENITDLQINALRDESNDCDDHAQVAICELALNGFASERTEYNDDTVGNLRILAEYFSIPVSQYEINHLKSIGFDTWTQGRARAECAKVIANAEAQVE